MPTGWVVANQFDPSITEGHPQLDRDVLDRLAPDRPMLVLESNGHVGYVNSAAMRAAGVDCDTDDPPTGRYGRDADGELNGRLEEAAAMAPFMVGLPALTAEELLARHRDLLWHAAGKGITMLHDCGIGVVGVPATSTCSPRPSMPTRPCAIAGCSCRRRTTPGSRWV